MLRLAVTTVGDGAQRGDVNLTALDEFTAVETDDHNPWISRLAL
jgi:hypothetical protein